MSSRPEWTDDRTREQKLRRRARQRGLELAKAYGQPYYFLWIAELRAPRARVFYDLDAVAAALADDDPPAG